MKLDKLVGERFKEKPSDCVVDSHALMVRGGYMYYRIHGQAELLLLRESYREPWVNRFCP